LIYNVGARVEYTDILTELVETNQRNPRDYANFFPSFSMKYNLPKDNSIQFSYSRRIRRPSFNDLNPFFTYNDPRNLYQGNPNLNPELTDSYELAHSKYWEKGSLVSAVFYRDRKDVINRILEVMNGDTTLLRSENINFQKELGLDISANYKIQKWWQVNVNLIGFHVTTPTIYRESDFRWRFRTSRVSFSYQF